MDCFMGEYDLKKVAESRIFYSLPAKTAPFTVFRESLLKRRKKEVGPTD